MEKSESSLLVGMQNGIGLLKNSLAVSYKVTQQSHTTRCFSKWNEKVRAYKTLYEDVYSNNIHDLQKVGKNQMFFLLVKTNKLYIYAMEYSQQQIWNRLEIHTTA